MPEGARAAVFLDRDGTINVRARPHQYVRGPEEFEWLPGAVEGIVALAAAGFPLVVVSNQRGVQRGVLSRGDLRAIEELIQAALAPHGCGIEAFRYCLHGLDAGCACRKPRPGLLIDAAAELGLDLASSWMIGDSEEDIAAGRAVGCRVVRIGEGSRDDVCCAPSLHDAATLIISLR